MKYYLDFEATQFSEYVISIGCVSEAGHQFSTLVQPPKKKKLTPFITNLTGITNEMLETAPTTESAFLALWNFINETNHDTWGDATFFYSYGDMDAIFIQRSASKIEPSPTQEFMYNLANSIIDFTKYVGEFFGVRQVSLQKVISYFRGTEQIQNHEALSDALWLAEVAEHIKYDNKPEINPWSGQEQKVCNKAFVNSKKNVRRPFIIQATSNSGKIHTFTNIRNARKWIWDCLYTEEQRAATTPQRCAAKVNAAVMNKKTYFSYTWEKIYLDEKEED